MRAFFVLVAVLLTSGCASYSDLNDGRRNNLGGGFEDKEVAPGLFHIVAKTNWAPWKNMAGAHKTFNRRASELCGEKFTVLQISESAYEPFSMPGYPPYIISQVEGYVLAARAKLTDSEARALIKKEPSKAPEPTPTAHL
jgi:hypothetical protein